MINLRGIAYSDIHWHEFNNGLTIDDCAEVEHQIYKRAVDEGVDMLAFLGDWYMLRNPPHHVRAQAEAALAERSSLAPPSLQEVRLVGNHDRESKNAHSGHSMMHLDIYGGHYDGYLTVMDQRRVYRFNKDVAIHAVPAGHSIETEPFTFDTAQVNIGMFHDLVRGSWIFSGNYKEQCSYGIDPRQLDRPEFDLVLGGDNHVRQDLNFRNTTGWYCGAAMQHSFGDTDQARGCLEFSIFKDGATKLVQVYTVNTTHPRFVTIDATIAHQDDLDAVMHTGTTPDHIFKVTLRGDGKLLSKLDQDKIAMQASLGWKARHVSVVLEPTVQFTNLIPELSRTKTVEEDWETYVKSGKLDADGVPSDLLIARGLEFLHGAKQ